MILEGKCWILGDNVPVDGTLLEMKYVHMRMTDPYEIAKHVLESFKPEFTEQCQPGDIIVAGNRFGQGNAHIQAFRGMFGLGIGVVAEWVTRGTYRNCIIAGVPFLPKCPGVSGMCSEGDRLRVDFATGLFENLTRGFSTNFNPIPERLLEIVELGGSTKYWTHKIKMSKVEGIGGIR